MVGLVKLVGMAVFALGVIFFLKPDQIKKWLNFWMQENHLYMGGLLSILVGIVFLIAAARCSIPWIIVVFSIMSLIKGVALFALGSKKVIAFAEKFTKRPPKALRRFAILSLAFGVLLIYAA
ncbi:MAG: hypothetical protein K9L86_07210 [Candidatus Omnitrophica bacterium]|nr:hypothetical protein [Candidatus Omnitrophota bacterium]